MDQPLVSVVIPTKGRPTLLGRAIDSVLQQTFTDFEVIVVLDGRDSESEEVLRRYNDPRLVWQAESTPIGAPFVRAIGIEKSRGDWIAFVDDDDEWFPNKLETQLELLQHSNSKPVVSFSRLIARSQLGEYVWPRRGPSEGEHVSDYLFARSELFTGESLIQPSTVIVSRQLLREVPWAEGKGLQRHEDWDWYLRAAAHGAQFVFSPETLAIWHNEEDRPRVSSQPGWRFSLDWAESRRSLMTKKAYSSFLLVELTGIAARTRAWEAWPVAWREAWRATGWPRTIDLLLFVGIRLLSGRARERLRAMRGHWELAAHPRLTQTAFQCGRSAKPRCTST